jgi:hypothetical protein
MQMIWLSGSEALLDSFGQGILEAHVDRIRHLHPPVVSPDSLRDHTPICLID